MKSKLALILTLLFASQSIFTLAAPADPLKVDKNHSTVGFKIAIMNGLSQVTGKFTDFDIVLVYDEKNPVDSTVTATIQAKSINTGIEARDKDLQSEQFFAVEKYPAIKFQSRKGVLKDGHILLTGDLTMLGVTKEVVLDVAPTGEVKYPEGSPLVGAKSYGFKATLRLNRTDYGMKWEHNAVKDFVSDFVDVEIFMIARSQVATKKPS